MPNAFIDTSRRPPLYFFHMPKTGGTSLRAFLADQYLDSERCSAKTWQALATLPKERVDACRLFYGHLSVNLREYLPPLTKAMTFLRDPVARTISTIRHMIRDPAFHPLHHLVRGRTLNEAIYNDRIMESLENVQTKLLSFDVPIPEVLDYVRARQAANLQVDTGELTWESTPDKALKALEAYDFVGLMERFQPSLLSACSEFGFVPPDVMPNLNVATDDNYPENLSPADLDHLRSYLSYDIALYELARVRLNVGADPAHIFSQLFSRGILNTVPTPFELDLGRPFIGSGWYEPELQGDSLARWSGPDPKATLYLPIDRTENHTARISIWKPRYVDIVNVLVGGRQIEVRESAHFRDFTIEFDLPAVANEQNCITTVTLDGKRISEYFERNDGDLRTLGFMLTSVKVL
jgi:hypothetical protein